MYWSIVLVCLSGFTYTSIQGAPALENELDSVLSSQDDAKVKIRDENLKYLSLYSGQLLKSSPQSDNILFSPLVLQLAFGMNRIKLFYEIPILALTYNKNEFFEGPKTLSNVVSSMVNDPGVKIEVETVVFLDQQATKKDYLADVKNYFKSEIIRVDLNNPSDTALLKTVNDWAFEKSKGTVPKIEKLPLVSGMTSLEMAITVFTGCWDTPKNRVNGKFKNGLDEIDIESINAKELIGYFNNPDSKYEAIRVPFGNEKFYISLVLPYENESLKIFYDFTDQDYKRLLEGISTHSQYVDYQIPLLNLTSILLNENGTSTIQNQPIVCQSSPSHNFVETSNAEYKTFNINRPFAVFIYHEESKEVLYSFFVKNPSVQSPYFHQVKANVNAKKDGIEFSKK